MTRKILIAALFGILGASVSGCATSAGSLDRQADHSIGVFSEQVNGAEIFLNQAAGYLVFPRVIKVGLGFGGETGEGALIVGGQTADYYRTTAGSFGLQATE